MTPTTPAPAAPAPAAAPVAMPKALPPSADDVTVIPVKGVRKLIAERMLASASGSAVAQNAHSADIRPMIQCVRPQPGQWFTSCSRYTA